MGEKMVALGHVEFSGQRFGVGSGMHYTWVAAGKESSRGAPSAFRTLAGRWERLIGLRERTVRCHYREARWR